MNTEEFNLKEAIRAARKSGTNYLEVQEKLIEYFKDPQDLWEKKNVIYYLVRRPWYVFFFLYKDEKLDGMGKYKNLFYSIVAEAPNMVIYNIVRIPLFSDHISNLLAAVRMISQRKYDEIECMIFKMTHHP